MMAAQIIAESVGYPLARAAIWFAAMIALVALGIVIVRKWRDGNAEDNLSNSELLTKFSEVHSRGGLSDEEYRTIKAKLAAELQAELNGNEKKS